MPIYGYRCTICGEEIEVLQAMSAAPLTICELCGGRLEKKLYPVGVLFKGSGFYSTDYKRAPEKPQEGRQQEARQDAKGNGAKSGSDRSERAQKKDQAATGSESASKREAASSSTSGPAAKGGD